MTLIFCLTILFKSISRFLSQLYFLELLTLLAEEASCNFHNHLNLTSLVLTQIIPPKVIIHVGWKPSGVWNSEFTRRKRTYTGFTQLATTSTWRSTSTPSTTSTFVGIWINEMSSDWDHTGEIHAPKAPSSLWWRITVHEALLSAY